MYCQLSFCLSILLSLVLYSHIYVLIYILIYICKYIDVCKYLHVYKYVIQYLRIGIAASVWSSCFRSTSHTLPVGPEVLRCPGGRLFPNVFTCCKYIYILTYLYIYIFIHMYTFYLHCPLVAYRAVSIVSLTWAKPLP